MHGNMQYNSQETSAVSSYKDRHLGSKRSQHRTTK